METSSIQEMNLNLRLIHDGKEIQTLHKVYGLKERNETEESSTKPLDEVITDFLNEAKDIANESGYTIGKDAINKATVALIICIFDQKTSERTIDIELSKKDVPKENGDSQNSNS